MTRAAGKFLGNLTTAQINLLPLEVRKRSNQVYDSTAGELRMYGVDSEAYPSILLGSSSGISGTITAPFVPIADGPNSLTNSTINEFSTDGTLGDDSDTAVPTEKAVKTYADTVITATRPLTGSGNPNAGAGTAPGFEGRLYVDTDNDIAYVNVDNTATGWVAI